MKKIPQELFYVIIQYFNIFIYKFLPSSSKGDKVIIFVLYLLGVTCLAQTFSCCKNAFLPLSKSIIKFKKKNYLKSEHSYTTLLNPMYQSLCICNVSLPQFSHLSMTITLVSINISSFSLLCLYSVFLGSILLFLFQLH